MRVKREDAGDNLGEEEECNWNIKGSALDSEVFLQY
jgi:hypothetical protein